jgi:hypothetical protein
MEILLNQATLVILADPVILARPASQVVSSSRPCQASGRFSRFTFSLTPVLSLALMKAPATLAFYLALWNSPKCLTPITRLVRLRGWLPN